MIRKELTSLNDPNYTIEKLEKIKNLTDIRCDTDYISKLSGVSKFCYYPSKCGKKILLLGEYYTKEGLCEADNTSISVNMWFITC